MADLDATMPGSFEEAPHCRLHDRVRINLGSIPAVQASSDKGHEPECVPVEKNAGGMLVAAFPLEQ